jgi:hypothetical protein
MDTKTGFLRSWVRRRAPIVSPSCVKREQSPRRSPGESYWPIKQLLAHPIVGVSNKTPKWQANPNRLGWARPWPSQISKSGAVPASPMLAQAEVFLEMKRGQGCRGSRPNLAECLSQAPRGFGDPGLPRPRITGLTCFRRRHLPPPPDKLFLAIGPIFPQTRQTEFADSPLRRRTRTRDGIA